MYFTLPQGAFFVWIHDSSRWALECPAELLGVAEGGGHPGAAGRVRVGQQLVHLVLGRVVAAPNLRVAHEEQLLGGEAEPRHWLLGGVVRVSVLKYAL